MTLIIGVRCVDGVVVGADSIATYGTPFGGSTIEQEVKSKIAVNAGCALFGASGAVGLSQLVAAQLQPHWSEILEMPVDRARTVLSELMWLQIKPAMDRAQLAINIMGQEAIDNVACSFLVALPLNDEPVLLKYDMQAESEEYPLDLPILSIGSGQAQADPFLAFIKRVMWYDRAPSTVREGILGVLWTLRHVIKVNAGDGVGGNPTIAVLRRIEGDWRAETLDEYHLAEQKQSLGDVERWLAQYSSGEHFA